MRAIYTVKCSGEVYKTGYTRMLAARSEMLVFRNSVWGLQGQP